MDRRLVEQARQGDRGAYEALITAVGARLFLVASRILRDPDGAADAVQETFIAIWRDLPSLRDPDRFEAWAYRTLVRNCRSRSRRERRLGVRFVELDEAIPASSTPADDAVIRDQLRRSFERLSLDHRAVLVLHHYLGLPLGEVAAIVDAPYGTVASRLHHAMRAMRAEIEAADREPVTGGQPA